MGKKKLRITGFYVFSKAFEKKMKNLGAKFPGGLPEVMHAASPEWEKLTFLEKRKWKHDAKVFRKTEEFKKMAKEYEELHRNSPTTPRKRFKLDSDDDEYEEKILSDWDSD